MAATGWVLAATLIAASPVFAAPPWSVPSTVATQAGGIMNPRLQADGKIVRAVWQSYDRARKEYVWRAALPGSAVQQFPRATAGRPVLTGDGGYAAALTLGGARPRLVLAEGKLGGDVRRGRTLAVASGIQVHDLARAPDGTLALAWTECPSERACLENRYRMRVAVRSSSGAWARTQLLDRRGAYELALPRAVLRFAPAGRLLAAYTKGADRIAVRVRQRGRWGSEQVLGAHRGFTDLRAETAPSGHLAVAWGSQDLGEEANEPWIVRASIRRPGRRRFGRAQVLDRGAARTRPVGSVVLGLDRAGRATVGWTQTYRSFEQNIGPPDAAPNPVRVATARRDGRFRPFAELARDGGVRDLAVASDGRALMVWERAAGDLAERAPGIEAALSPAPAQAFGAAESVSPDREGGSSDAVFDALTGMPGILWVTGSADPPVSVLRWSTRSAP